MRALLDTSVFIAKEQIAGPLPDELGISVVTLAELECGVVVATGETRELRRRTCAFAQTFNALPIDADVARAFAHLFGALVAEPHDEEDPRHVDRVDGDRARRAGLHARWRLRRDAGRTGD